MAVSRIEERATHAYIRRRTVRLLDLTDKSAGGSAVTVKLGARFLLATAAHVIPVGHDIRVLVGEDHEDDLGDFMAWHVDEDDDVGLLELSESAASAIHRDFTDGTSLLSRLDQTQAWSATLIGYPGQLIETDSVKRQDTLYRTYSFRTLVLATQIIKSSEWPTSDSFLRRRPEADSDIFVSFDPKAALFQQSLVDLEQAEVPSDITDISLGGMSGCGIWLDHSPTTGIWLPDPLLAGIDTSVNTKQGWARGSLIQRWVRLVTKHYPDLSFNLQPD